MKFHTIAAILPMMQAPELNELANDIKTLGLREPIVTYEGMILDGRNRYNACLQAQVEPEYVEFSGIDPLAFVMSLNVHRRHLTASQKACVAIDAEPFYKEAAKKRMLTGVAPDPKELIPQGQARDQAAAAVGGVSGRYVSDAKIIKEKDPDAFEEIKQGNKTITKVKKQNQIEDARAAATRQTRTQAKQSPPTVYLESYIDFSKRFNKHSIDLLLTDPPYMTDVENIEEFARLWLPDYLNKIKPTGRGYVFIGSYPRELRAYLNVNTPPHLVLEQVLVWTYKNTLGQNPKNKYKQNWQAILYFSGVQAANLDCPLTAEQWAVQEINAPDGRQGDRFHEWQKPLELSDRFIRHNTQPGDIVIDPFACTGTFLLSAARLGRKAFGCDISQDNIKIAGDRGCMLHGTKI